MELVSAGGFISKSRYPFPLCMCKCGSMSSAAQYSLIVSFWHRKSYLEWPSLVYCDTVITLFFVNVAVILACRCKSTHKLPVGLICRVADLWSTKNRMLMLATKHREMALNLPSSLNCVILIMEIIYVSGSYSISEYRYSSLGSIMIIFRADTDTDFGHQLLNSGLAYQNMNIEPFSFSITYQNWN